MSGWISTKFSLICRSVEEESAGSFDLNVSDRVTMPFALPFREETDEDDPMEVLL